MTHFREILNYPTEDDPIKSTFTPHSYTSALTGQRYGSIKNGKIYKIFRICQSIRGPKRKKPAD
jgi:hypothetical protein